jgi:hypothetical protein
MTDSAAHSSAWRVTPDAYEAANPPPYPPGCDRFSVYVAARDSTRLAVDVHLPLGRAKDARLPVIVIFTPYYRRFRLKDGHPNNVEPSPNTALYRDAFVPHGYAVVVVDVRGTGASFGARYGFRSPVERDDYSDIADWIVKQPWSNGRIGSIGISYVGAAADFLATTGHPAVKAVAPTFAVWDTYGDHFYPGGVYMSKLAVNYDGLMDALDRDDREQLKRFAYFGDPNFIGPAPVDDDPDGALVPQAVAEHAGNFDMPAFMGQLEFRDAALSYDPDYTIEKICPYFYSHNVRKDVAYLCVSGWMDGGGFMNGAINRFRSLSVANKHLLIGPWDHGARTNVSPFRTQPRSEFKLLAEVRRFFDEYLAQKDTRLKAESPVHYFTIAAERWNGAADWRAPALAHQALHLAAGSALTQRPPSADGSDVYHANYGVESGADTRYERLFAYAVESYYESWNGRDTAMLRYTGEPLAHDLEVLGHPIATLYLASSERDGVVHVYLEDVAPDGACRYVTEGLLRALHRKVADAPTNLRAVGPYHSYRRADAALMTPGEVHELKFALFPTNWLFRKGHRIRVAIAAADRRHFARIPDGRLATMTFHRSRAHSSRIELPVA